MNFELLRKSNEHDEHDDKKSEVSLEKPASTIRDISAESDATETAVKPKRKVSKSGDRKGSVAGDVKKQKRRSMNAQLLRKDDPSETSAIDRPKTARENISGDVTKSRKADQSTSQPQKPKKPRKESISVSVTDETKDNSDDGGKPKQKANATDTAITSKTNTALETDGEFKKPRKISQPKTVRKEIDEEEEVKVKAKKTSKQVSESLGVKEKQSKKDVDTETLKVPKKKELTAKQTSETPDASGPSTPRTKGIKKSATKTSKDTEAKNKGTESTAPPKKKTKPNT